MRYKIYFTPEAELVNVTDTDILTASLTVSDKYDENDVGIDGVIHW